MTMLPISDSYDRFIDKNRNVIYAHVFQAEDAVQYSAGLTGFMERNKMNEVTVRAWEIIMKEHELKLIREGVKIEEILEKI